MARPSYANRIRQRMAHLESVITDAQRELDELRVAARVLERLGTDEDDEDAPRPSRPRTVGEIIIEVLEGADGPLEAQEITLRVGAIQETTANTVSTTLSRLKATGRVDLFGRLWSLPERKEASEGDDPAEASVAGSEGPARPEDPF